MTSVVSQPPWWRVALGFLIALFAPALVAAAAVVRGDALPAMIFLNVPAVLIGGLLFIFWMQVAKPRFTWTSVVSGVLTYLTWPFTLGVVILGEAFNGDDRPVGDILDALGRLLPEWHEEIVSGSAFAIGAVTGAVFWLIVYGWRGRPA